MNAAPRHGALAGQGLHAAGLAASIVVLALASSRPSLAGGEFLGVATPTWFWLSVLAPVLHQVWVALAWRAELHGGHWTRWFGRRAFRVYAVGFALLAALRFAFLVPLAAANRGTLDARSPWLGPGGLVTWLVATVAGATLVSVVRQVGFRRAVGADHFEPRWRDEPWPDRGLMRWVRNPMYTLALGVVWLPGLFASSAAALVVAAFSHVYIWLHFFATERPDLRRIYGTADGSATRP